MEHMSAQPEAWVAFLLSACPENVVPKVWPDASTAEESIRRLLLLKCFRPDRMLAAIVTYVQHRHMAESSYNFDSAPPMKPAQSENGLRLVKVRGLVTVSPSLVQPEPTLVVQASRQNEMRLEWCTVLLHLMSCSALDAGCCRPLAGPN